MASRALDGGYVLIFRRVLDNAVFRTHAEALAFVDLILRASWAPVCLRYKGHVIELQRGQLAVSVRDLADDLEWKKDRVARFLEKLAKHDMIETANATGVTVISIRNYDTYQSSGEDTATPREPEPRQHRDSTATQNKQDNQGNEGRRDSADAESVDAATREAVEAVVGIAKHAKRITRGPAINAVEAYRTWNVYAKRNGWPCVAKLTEDRRTKVRTRIRELGGMVQWEGLLSRAECSELLSPNPPTWWGFDWLITNETNPQKVLEGRYDRKFGNGAGDHRRSDEQSSGNGMVRAVLAERAAREGR